MAAFSKRLCRAAAALHCTLTFSAMRPHLDKDPYTTSLCGRAAESMSGEAASREGRRHSEAQSLLEAGPIDEDPLNKTAVRPVEVEEAPVSSDVALPAEDEVVTADPIAPDATAPQLFQTFELMNFPAKLGKAERDVLNGKYVEHPTARMNRQPIFVGGQGNHFFIYWCSKEEDWRIGVFVDWGKELACNCLAFAHTDRHAELLNPDVPTRFPGLQDGVKWQTMLDLVPHVSDKTEQSTPPEVPMLPGNKLAFQPPVLDRSTVCVPQEVTNFAPAPYGAAPAPQVNVNLNLGLHFNKKHKNASASSSSSSSSAASARSNSNA